MVEFLPMLRRDEVAVRICCEWQQWRVLVSDRSGLGGRDESALMFHINLSVCFRQIVIVQQTMAQHGAGHVTNLFAHFHCG